MYSNIYMSSDITAYNQSGLAVTVSNTAMPAHQGLHADQSFWQPQSWFTYSDPIPEAPTSSADLFGTVSAD
jgi:hypothetical protein